MRRTDRVIITQGNLQDKEGTKQKHCFKFSMSQSMWRLIVDGDIWDPDAPFNITLSVLIF
jgi:hypothetical protein